MRLQIGAGLDGPTSWMNVDASPTLWLQRLPMVGVLLQRLLQVEGERAKPTSGA